MTHPTQMLEAVEPGFFEVLPLEFCLQFLVVPVKVDEGEVHVLGREPIPGNVLRYIERISRRSVVPIPCDEQVEDRIAGFLHVMCRTPAVVERAKASQADLLSFLRHSPVWGPDCWDRLHRVNVTLASTSQARASRVWVSVLPPGLISIRLWDPTGTSAWEHRVRVERDTAALLSRRADGWAVMLSAPDESIQTMQFTRQVGPDAHLDEGMSLGSASQALVAMFDDDRSAESFKAQMEELLRAVARPARIFARPPGLWR